MPSSRPAPQSARGGPTRRQLLGVPAYAAGALATAGCGLRIDTGPAPTPAPPPPSPDELARERAAAEADRLLDNTLALARMRPDVGTHLTRIAAAHRAHARALRPVPAATAAATSETTTPPSATSTSPGTANPSATTTPTAGLGRALDVGALATGERTAANAVLADLSGVSATTARLLSSVAAARLVHADLLAALPSRFGRGRPSGEPT